jgi:hypothetical protein
MLVKDQTPGPLKVASRAKLLSTTALSLPAARRASCHFHVCLRQLHSSSLHAFFPHVSSPQSSSLSPPIFGPRSSEIKSSHPSSSRVPAPLPLAFHVQSIACRRSIPRVFGAPTNSSPDCSDRRIEGTVDEKNFGSCPAFCQDACICTTLSFSSFQGP